MGNRGHWLGFLAVGLAAVALLVAVTGRSSSSRAVGPGPRGDFYGPGAATRPDAQSGAAAPQAPNAGARPDAQSGADTGHAPNAGRWGRSWHEHQDFRDFGRGHRFGRGPHMPFFAWPFEMMRGVWEALLAIVLIVLGLRLLRGRPGPGPENGPHTGETRRL